MIPRERELGPCSRRASRLGRDLGPGISAPACARALSRGLRPGPRALARRTSTKAGTDLLKPLASRKLAFGRLARGCALLRIPCRVLTRDRPRATTGPFRRGSPIAPPSPI